jgi:EAL domain-containing protein (putative c-di-GMP-specific phosphodiesterase class I)
VDQPRLSPEALEEYRQRYLKLKSVLHDRTTGLPAFPALIDQLRRMLDARRSIGVINLNIENLDLVESLYGWQVFDRVRSRVAFVLREALGTVLPQTSLLAVGAVADGRFVVFIEEQADGREVHSAFLSRTGEALCRQLHEAFEERAFSGLSPRLKFLAGHALLSENPFYRFERRLYAAIDESGDYNERRRRRREESWGGELREIIETAAIETVFQPVVELATRKLLGLEAFARGPKDSMFEQPRAMFSLSDRFGVSTELDRICREAALRARALMQGGGKLFLNALPHGVGEQEWHHEGLLQLLADVPLDPADLVLEFSERCADADPDAFVAAMDHLKAKGFAVALDDIGTGYASQAILERVKPDFLKLDVSLVRNIHENLIKQELLASLVRIAARMDAAVIAEGVESTEEVTALLRLGAKYGQGFLFAEPTSSGRLPPSKGPAPLGREH